MKNLYRVTLFFGILTLSQACVHYSDRLKSELDPWIGQHPDQLVEKWGAPNSSYAMQSGVNVLTYINDRQVSRASGLGYSSWRWSNYSYNDSCRINFFTDPSQKKIEKYTTVGDASSCVETLSDVKRSSN